jgi:hypothetical protein
MADALEIDELQMYFGEDYIVNSYITIHQPTIGEIVKYGEREYYSMIHTLTCIPSDMKSQLWDLQIDYMEISDFTLFMLLTRALSQEQTSLIFGDLDLSKLYPYTNTQNEQIVLCDETGKIIIDELAYMKIVNYLRKLHGIKPKVEIATTKTVKKILIQLDRERIEKQKNQPYKSQLKELISGMMRYPGFKYKKNELKECGLYEFMDTVQGAQIYVSSTALLQGSYSGMIDTSKIDKNNFNWLRSE